MDVVVPRVDRPLAGIKTRQRCVCRLCPAGWWLYVDIYGICVIYVNILSDIYDTYDVSVVRYMHIYNHMYVSIIKDVNIYDKYAIYVNI